MKTVIVQSILIIGVCLTPSYSRFIFPSFIKQCIRKDPNISKCAIESAKIAIPHIVNGVKELNIPNMKPLVLPYLELESSKTLTLSFTNLEIHGLERAVPVDIIFDYDNKKLMCAINIDKVVLKGPYKIDGQIMVLNIKGSGTSTTTIYGGQYNYSMDYEPHGKDGTHGTVKKDEIKFHIEKVEFNFDNLFNGDKKLGDEMNRVLNDNWKEIINDLGPVIGKTISTTLRKLADSVFKIVPFNDILL